MLCLQSFYSYPRGPNKKKKHFPCFKYVQELWEGFRLWSEVMHLWMLTQKLTLTIESPTWNEIYAFASAAKGSKMHDIKPVSAASSAAALLIFFFFLRADEWHIDERGGFAADEDAGNSNSCTSWGKERFHMPGGGALMYARPHEWAERQGAMAPRIWTGGERKSSHCKWDNKMGWSPAHAPHTVHHGAHTQPRFPH